MTTQPQADALAAEIKRRAHAYADAKLARYGLDQFDPNANPVQLLDDLHAAVDRLRDLAASAAQGEAVGEIELYRRRPTINSAGGRQTFEPRPRVAWSRAGMPPVGTKLYAVPVAAQPADPVTEACRLPISTRRRIDAAATVLSRVMAFMRLGAPTDVEVAQALSGLRALQANDDIAQPLTPEQRPVFYVRCHPDGTLTGEVLSAESIEPVRVRSGAWVPLYAAQPLEATSKKPTNNLQTKPERCPDFYGFIESGGLDYAMAKARAMWPERAGWKLVPVVPTDKMIGAGIEAYRGKCEESYRAMLEAAPPAPAAEKREPLTDEQISIAACEGWWSVTERDSFEAGARWAEEKHGITPKGSA